MLFGFNLNLQFHPITECSHEKLFIVVEEARSLAGGCGVDVIILLLYLFVINTRRHLYVHDWDRLGYYEDSFLIKIFNSIVKLMNGDVLHPI